MVIGGQVVGARRPIIDAKPTTKVGCLPTSLLVGDQTDVCSDSANEAELHL